MIIIHYSRFDPNFLLRWIFGAFFLLSVSLATYYAEAADTVTVTFYHTSDLHENSANLPQTDRLVRDKYDQIFSTFESLFMFEILQV